MFIETLSVLKIRNNAEKVDVCVVCDSSDPAGRRGYSNINPDNFRHYLFNLLPIVATSPYLGALFQFDSRAEFNRFLRENADRYHVFPPIRKQLAETYNFYGGVTLKEMRDFYRDYGYIPHLNVPEYNRSWAYSLHRERLKGLLPVSVSLRFTGHAVERNADRDVWLRFFDLCKSAFPEVGFVVVGLREEAFDDLHQRSNVVIAKDHGSNILDDFAIIRTSLFYMGSLSGVTTIALFSDLPYLFFGLSPMTARHIRAESNGNLAFATDYQKYFPDFFRVTPQSLLKEFAELYDRIDKDAWRKKAAKNEDVSHII